MDFFQDQSIIQVAVVVLGALLAWWILRGIFRWLRRLSKIGCLAGLALLTAAVVILRLS
jgi:hypothetical protein